MNKMMLHKSSLFIALCLILSLLLTACGGGAQAKESYTIGVVNYVPALDAVFEGFKAEMAEQGYVEGENVTYLYNGLVEPDPQATDREVNSLLDQDVDLFLTLGTLPTLRAKQAVEGTEIPVIFAPVINPVEEGVVDSIRQPGGNVTGVQNGNTIAKALEWLLKIAPPATKVYVPYHPEDKVAVTSIKPLSEIASTLGVELMLGEAHSQEEVIATLESLPQDTVVFLIPSPSLEPSSNFIEVAVKHDLAVGSTNHSQSGAGALVSYGANFFAMGGQAARLADQALHGIHPGELPVETAEYFLNINLKTAEAIGLDISDEILRQADTVIR
jgi:putative tryptophan/tyrosine transport system substrate-binding protein